MSDTLNIQLFYETIARIVAARYDGVEIKVKSVHRKSEGETGKNREAS